MFSECLNLFLRKISEGDINAAALAFEEEFKDEQHKNIARNLKIICQSQLIRQRQSKLSGLNLLRNSGFRPELVLDVGAQVGTPELYTVFPDSHHIFVEPVVEWIPSLEKIAQTLRSAEVINCGVSDFNGVTRLNVSPSRQYASIAPDCNMLGAEDREIQVRTVNAIVENLDISKPILLKIDVDGLELKVLDGARSVLEQNTVIIIEATLYADGDSRINSIIQYLNSFNYKVYDIVDHLYQENYDLWQVDLILRK